MDLAKAIIWTEQKIRQFETCFPPSGVSSHEWLMWLPQSEFSKKDSTSLTLKKIENEDDWVKMIDLRIQIESRFGIRDHQMIRGFVSDIQNKTKELGGTWFLAYLHGDVVGEVGLIVFEYENLKIARLQDVDIAPAYQGMGLGRQLLERIVENAMRMDVDGLALFARQDSWVKDWYQRFGFIKVGESSK